jgi:hypothetical protein
MEMKCCQCIQVNVRIAFHLAEQTRKPETGLALREMISVSGYAAIDRVTAEGASSRMAN